MPTLQPPIAANPKTLERNLAALGRVSPLNIHNLEDVTPSDELDLVQSEENCALTGQWRGRWLASRRRPLSEATRLAQTVDPRTAGAIIVLGFGLGHHVAALAKRCKNESLLILYEPDAALLRAVLERIDHSQWMRRANIILAVDAEDSAFLAAAIAGGEGAMAMGVKIVEHPPSRQRLGDAASTFCDTFSRVLAAARTTVVTTLVQSQTTCRNFLNNVCSYVAHPGVADLHNRCAGQPAITVAAGPSLARNIELLRTPGLRDRCVIIAAQTVLKPLLEIGVRPHFVTALDFHAISARFYEGLRPEEVADTTLVVEPKANPAIVGAYPGPIRMPREQTLDLLLGADLAGEHGAIRSGSTVAHLSYYLARFLGCDPVILIGQDLGFTDGLYYADGAAIHSTWAGELNPFRSLEMLEWERVARQRRQLRKIPSIHDGEIYTDEQMATYLTLFERIFLNDADAGLHVIDATEGGALKANTETATLAEALGRYVGPDAPLLPSLAPPTPDQTAERLAAARRRVLSVRRDVVTLARISRDTAKLLERMAEVSDDKPALNHLIRQAHKRRDQAMALQPAFELVQRLNQLGAFKRARADRDIKMTDLLDSGEIQTRRIERDMVNVRWIADAADALADQLDEAVRERAASARHPRTSNHDTDASSIPVSRASRLVAAVIPVDPDTSSLGAPRDLDRPIAGRNALQWTLTRLAQSKRIRRAIILSPDVDRARALIGEPPEGLRVEHQLAPRAGMTDAAVAAARLWSRSSWRGGIAGLTGFDEIITLDTLREMFGKTDLRAALLVGADWSLVDPQLCDMVIDRWLEAPRRDRLTFTQAPPGLCGCVLARGLLDDLARAEALSMNTVGALLSYHPHRPSADPVAHRACPTIDIAIRDARARFVADDPACLALMDQLGEQLATISAGEIVSVWRRSGLRPPAPEQVEIELCAGRPPHGCAPAWLTQEDAPRRTMPVDLARRIISSLDNARPDVAITLTGPGDPLTHPAIFEIIQFAHDAGIAGVHVRTPLLAPEETIVRLGESGVSVISVDLLANTAATYEAIMGADRFRDAIENINLLANCRDRIKAQEAPDRAAPWITPRITRCEPALAEIEAFYDKWLVVLGAAAIDPLPAGVATGRITALRAPDITAQHECASTLTVRADGVVAPGPARSRASSIGDLREADLLELWRAVGVS